ncbi:hypothetical protein IPC1147_31825 [Pseudomonas aeruginosa]|nr:hypothetical protein IPC1107_31745 [Pseudomonas aeruginosa]RRS18837.1 hypothetical protein IPC1147_31825 [Pseudomonas aeruginosa]HBP5919974.1 hypothetical protein [Pseudomonas aeruginosa]HBP6061002.1 hypothetical protein [Pseudomonas aeruginosa]HBP6170192.1 hypothetical protein [Pseudomonas aeruginosa]
MGLLFILALADFSSADNLPSEVLTSTATCSDAAAVTSVESLSSIPPLFLLHRSATEISGFSQLSFFPTVFGGKKLLQAIGGGNHEIRAKALKCFP